MSEHESYRGYRIEYRNRYRRAFIWPPNSGLAIETIPTASSTEGAEILKQRAYAAIDADIDR
jgi:hypothetical protein